MNEEEKKAIEYSKNCLMKITLGIDCEFDVNILDTLLNIIKKLQKENTEQKSEIKKIKHNNQTLKSFVSGIFNENIEKDFIPVQKVEDKIEEYKNILKTCNKVKDIDRIKAINERILELEELLEGRK